MYTIHYRNRYVSGRKCCINNTSIATTPSMKETYFCFNTINIFISLNCQPWNINFDSFKVYHFYRLFLPFYMVRNFLGRFFGVRDVVGRLGFALSARKDWVIHLFLAHACRQTIRVSSPFCTVLFPIYVGRE